MCIRDRLYCVLYCGPGCNVYCRVYNGVYRGLERGAYNVETTGAQTSGSSLDSTMELLALARGVWWNMMRVRTR
eukprot:101311-Lingulodinium_polyedra.AAC.1